MNSERLDSQILSNSKKVDLTRPCSTLTSPGRAFGVAYGKGIQAVIHEEMAQVIEETAMTFSETPGALLPLLHAVQDRIGWIPDDAVPHIAQSLNLSRADVHGVLTFYHDFRRRPPARHIVKLCRAEACRARGAMAIESRMSERFDVSMNQVRSDNHVALEAIYCLGLCASGPNALVDGIPVSRIDDARVQTIAETLAL